MWGDKQKSKVKTSEGKLAYGKLANIDSLVDSPTHLSSELGR
jgi:hypothetical protein